eukprot:9866152-Alexandrium_andersonii.AAC.1
MHTLHTHVTGAHLLILVEPHADFTSRVRGYSNPKDGWMGPWKGEGQEPRQEPQQEQRKEQAAVFGCAVARCA